MTKPLPYSDPRSRKPSPSAMDAPPCDACPRADDCAARLVACAHFRRYLYGGTTDKGVVSVGPWPPRAEDCTRTHYRACYSDTDRLAPPPSNYGGRSLRPPRRKAPAQPWRL